MTDSGGGWRWHRSSRPAVSGTTDTRIVTDLEPLTERPSRERRSWDRIRTVSISCTIVNVLCGLFATVLLMWIFLVIGEANPANGVAGFVRGFAAAVSLGYDDLFTPADTKARVLLNDGLAAITWLGIGALATMLIRRLALPGRSDSQIGRGR